MGMNNNPNMNFGFNNEMFGPPNYYYSGQNLGITNPVNSNDSKKLPINASKEETKGIKFIIIIIYNRYEK